MSKRNLSYQLQTHKIQADQKTVDKAYNTNYTGLRMTRLGITVHVCCCSIGSVLTGQVLKHHIWSMFHKEPEHGGTTRAALQPEQHRSFISGRLSAEQHTELRSQPHLLVTLVY